jgi:hypothetical protein
LIILIILGEEYKSQSSSLCNFLHLFHFETKPEFNRQCAVCPQPGI